MAGAADKKLAQANTLALQQLHTTSVGINAAACVFVFLLKRPRSAWPYLVFLVPALACQYVIERSGRPVVRGNTTVSPGHDLSQQGVTEWLFDVVYLTWVLDVLMCVLGTNKVWYLYLAIPGYALYKGYGLVKGVAGLRGGPRAGAAADAPAPGPSKRQAKLAARNRRPA